MEMRENIFIIAFILSILSMVVSLKRIKSFDRVNKMEGSKKSYLVGMSIVCPFLALILTRNLRY